MGDPLLVSIQSADRAMAAGFADRLREELERRGAGPARVAIEVLPPGSRSAGLVARVEDGVERAVIAVLARLGERTGGAGASTGSPYSPEEEAEVRKRLEDLGYM